MTSTALNCELSIESLSAARASSTPSVCAGDGWQKLDITDPPMSTAEPRPIISDFLKNLAANEPAEWREKLDHLLGLGNKSSDAYRLAEDTIERILSVECAIEPEINATDDDGVTLIFENDRNGRELTVVIPEDGSRRLFAAISEHNAFRLVGAIYHSIAIENLARWLQGETQSLPELGLVLPSLEK